MPYEGSFRLLSRVLLLVHLLRVATACKDGSSCPDLRFTINNTLCVNGQVIDLLPETAPAALYACSDSDFDDIISYVKYDHPLLQIRTNASWRNTTISPTFDKDHLGKPLVQYVVTGSATFATAEYDTNSTYEWLSVMYWKGKEIFRQLHQCTLLVRGTNNTSRTENPSIPTYPTTTPTTKSSTSTLLPGTDTSTKSTHGSGSKALRFEMSLLSALLTIVCSLFMNTYFRVY